MLCLSDVQLAPISVNPGLQSQSDSRLDIFVGLKKCGHCRVSVPTLDYLNLTFQATSEIVPYWVTSKLIEHVILYKLKSART